MVASSMQVVGWQVFVVSTMVVVAIVACRRDTGGGGRIVTLSTEVVGWWSRHRLRGGGVAGVVWWKMERVRTRDLEKILKCPCLRVFAYIIISAH